jgi:hypothetical protein
LQHKTPEATHHPAKDKGAKHHEKYIHDGTEDHQLLMPSTAGNKAVSGQASQRHKQQRSERDVALARVVTQPRHWTGSGGLTSRLGRLHQDRYTLGDGVYTDGGDQLQNLHQFLFGGAIADRVADVQA